ncbi:hypothetical protein [Streptomyces montanisoli]|uniref:PASTA domain-containing protein n=1 Tax=Streptomyces montanisoli TaxID=2798581 RepID=A0A940M7A3_9ACTN|nr:hypothetical protein [Streptomyces montanisoli]MBP0457499.1 hypothetical protein [Streptomyces montanisoli]
MRGWKPVLVVLLLAGVSACTASSRPSGPDHGAGRQTASAQPTATSAGGRIDTPFDGSIFIGGNAAGVRAQIDTEAHPLSFVDVSGRHRDVTDEADWKVCAQEPSKVSQAGGQVVVFGVVMTGEHC